jgi:hypothetical protein
MTGGNGLDTSEMKMETTLHVMPPLAIGLLGLLREGSN